MDNGDDDPVGVFTAGQTPACIRKFIQIIINW